MIHITVFATPGLGQTSGHGSLQVDLQGDIHHSRYNFTDLKTPYDGIDGWSEFKLTLWLDGSRSLGLFSSNVLSVTSERVCWWQRNLQIGGGLQWYPFLSRDYLRSIRLYGLGGWRYYYDMPAEVEVEDTDLRIGVDWYFDNLFQEKPVVVVAWTDGGYRKTNFSLQDYDAFLWSGNVKVGAGVGHHWILPYGVVEWTWAPKHGERWWENYVRVGAGVRWYPVTVRKNTGFGLDVLRRFHVFGEALYNLWWLGGEPLPGEVSETDLRFGLGFSTGGFLRKEPT